MGAIKAPCRVVSAPQLAATYVKALLKRTGIEGGHADEEILGNVIRASMGQNPARQVPLFADLPPAVGATTVNKICGSGLKAVMLVGPAIQLGDAGLVVAGDMESMTRTVPPDQAREDYRLGTHLAHVWGGLPKSLCTNTLRRGKSEGA
jgi:acetyl-CoA C-acetyltransferase